MNNENQYIDPVGLLPKILSGEGSNEEKRIVSDWISASDANRREFETFRKLWNITDSRKAGEIDLDAEWRKMELNISPGGKMHKPVNLLLRIAASIILITALGIAVMKVTSPETLKAPSREMATFELPDGTRIAINAGSRISYKKGFGTTHRNLRLKGEGFFEVRKMKTPFVIEAQEASIIVTGTKFNLSAYGGDQELKLTVTEGSVRLIDTDRPEIEINVEAGETGIYHTASESVSKKLSVDLNDFAWRTKIIEFNNTPLIEVTEVLRNTYHLPLIADTLVQRCTITVRFEDQQADSVLNILQSTLDLTFTRKGKQILITGPGC